MKTYPFLMFTGNAEEAINFYISTIPNSKIVEIRKYEDHADKSQIGKIEIATIELNRIQFKCIDSPPVHEFGFTPSFSIFLDCDSEKEVENLSDKLSEGGTILMPLDSYPFSKRYTWVNDKFGISWQIKYN